MTIGQQVSVASKNYCYICVISSNNDVIITIFICDLHGTRHGYQLQDGYHTTHVPLQMATYCFN